MTPAKNRVVKAPQWYDFPIKGLVEISPRAGDGDRKVQTVYLDGVDVGKVESYTQTPQAKLPGTRLRKDLAPRRVWKPVQEDYTRLTYDTLGRAVGEVLEDHKNRLEAGSNEG